MGKIVVEYKPSFWDKIYVPMLFKGLLVTLRHIFSKKVTVEYPEQRHQPPEGYRGLHRLNKDEQGRVKCVACEMCATACPSHCITITPAEAPWEDRERYPVKFEIDLLRCIYCGFCEEACPEDAIELTEIYDFADYARSRLVATKDDLLRLYDLTYDRKYNTERDGKQVFYMKDKEPV